MEKFYKNRVFESKNHVMVSMKFLDIVNDLEMWVLNRETDESRVEEIVSCLERKEYIVPLIHVAYTENRFLIYDGMHRFMALKKYNKNVDVLVDFLVDDERSCVSIEDIVPNFLLVNKQVPVPQVYIDSAIANYEKDFLRHHTIKNQILDVVRDFERMYPKFISVSARPHAPNFNRDKFTDNIYELCVRHNPIDVYKVKEILEKLNKKYDDIVVSLMSRFEHIVDDVSRTKYIQTKLKEMYNSHEIVPCKIIDKCVNNKFWLFHSGTIVNEHFDTVLREENVNY